MMWRNPVAANKYLREVLVDTCVFVDFLRGTPPLDSVLDSLIREGRVVLSTLVRLELLQGVKKSESASLSSLLDGFMVSEFDQRLLSSAETLLPLARSGGLSFGLVDYLIVLQALGHNLVLLTSDKTMKKLARRLEVKIFSRF